MLVINPIIRIVRLAINIELDRTTRQLMDARSGRRCHYLIMATLLMIVRAIAVVVLLTAHIDFNVGTGERNN